MTTGLVVERRVVRLRRAGSSGADELGGLRGDPVTVLTEDGVSLHAEVDEVAPYNEGAKNPPSKGIGRLRRAPDPEPTVVFVHGFALNLDCWHFQREYFRGKHRMVLYDQRSHGRSGRSDRQHATIDQLGRDLARVLEELVPQGKVVLVGHSMGGMAILAFAEHHRDTFEERVVGTALVSTTAGGFKTHHIISRLIPDGLASQVGPRLVAGLALAPDLVDRVRRRGSNIGFLVADQFAFGDDVPASYVEFVDNMLAATSFEVIAQFFPHFDTLDKFTVLEAFAGIPTTSSAAPRTCSPRSGTAADGLAPVRRDARRVRRCRAHGDPGAEGPGQLRARGAVHCGLRASDVEGLVTVLVTSTAEDTRSLGVRLASLLRRGDLLVLSGDLGARRQDDAHPGSRPRARRARRRHVAHLRDLPRPPFLTDGPALVHVDAYRLGSPR